jgi:hypothetical protein
MMARHSEHCKCLFKVITIICQNKLLEKVEGESIAIRNPMYLVILRTGLNDHI